MIVKDDTANQVHESSKEQLKLYKTEIKNEDGLWVSIFPTSMQCGQSGHGFTHHCHWKGCTYKHRQTELAAAPVCPHKHVLKSSCTFFFGLDSFQKKFC